MRDQQRFVFIVPVVAFCFLFSMFSGDIGSRTVWAWFGMAFTIARILRLEGYEHRLEQSRISHGYLHGAPFPTSSLQFGPHWEEQL
jgi:hypothetical protein